MTLQCDSRLLKPGDEFLVLPGGEAYIEDAKKRGASILYHPEARRFWSSYMRARYPKQPEICVAVTGTNGKTSVVSMVRQLWQCLHKKAAALGTLGLDGHTSSYPLPSLTTLGSAEFYKLLHEMSGVVTHLAFEASSHGLDQHRFDDIDLTVACFTNLTQDHLDYHTSLDAYFQAKARLFTDLNPTFKVINCDDPYGKTLPATLTYGLSSRADLSIEQNHTVRYLGKIFPVDFPFSVPFQLYNLLAAMGIVLSSGVSIEDILPHIKDLKAAPGRLEHVTTFNEAKIYVDYAHTPDALENILKAGRAMTKSKLWVVFGCGGNRDAAKRPLMGRIAARLADFVVITDDNPRFEDPEAIRRDIKADLQGGHIYEIGDRQKAIEFAITQLHPLDVLIIAGKGHENTQNIQGILHPFSDQEIVKVFCL